MVRKKWYSGREGWGKREIDFLLSVEHNSCSAICDLRNKVKLSPPFLQEAEGVQWSQYWPCGPVAVRRVWSHWSSHFAMCQCTDFHSFAGHPFSVSIWKWPDSLATWPAAFWPLHSDGSWANQIQVVCESDLSVFVPKLFLSRPFSFISAKAHTTQSSTASGFPLPFPQTCHETQ